MYVPDRSASKRSPPTVLRASSGVSVDLEGARTPRYRQPSTPHRSALKHHLSDSGVGPSISLHVAAHGLSAPPAVPQLRLVPGVHLLPRTPGALPGHGLAPNVARTMAAVQDAQAARRDAYLSQQVAEQVAMREYLRSKPQHQVGAGGLGWWVASACLSPLPARLPALLAMPRWPAAPLPVFTPRSPTLSTLPCR